MQHAEARGSGWLLRTKKDAGIVALLDKRAVTKGYGKRLLASLPPATRVGTLDEVRAFWEGILRTEPAGRDTSEASDPSDASEREESAFSGAEGTPGLPQSP